MHMETDEASCTRTRSDIHVNAKTSSNASLRHQYENVNLDPHDNVECFKNISGNTRKQIPFGLHKNPSSTVRQQYCTIDLESDPIDLENFDDSANSTHDSLGLDNKAKSLVGQQYHNIDPLSHPPDLKCFEECHNTTKKSLDMDNTVNDERKGKFTILWKNCFHCVCPFIPILRALISCDMETFWKIVPLIIGVKAFYSSCITLGLCTMFKVQRLNLHHNITIGNETSSIMDEAYFFGLWTYTDNVQVGETLENFFTKEVERIETCRFHMNEVDDQTPDKLFLNDTTFNMARSFAIAAVVLGLFSMVSIYLTAANCSVSRGNSKIWLLFGTLLACGIFESFTFLVLESSVCKDIEDIEYMDGRHCSLEEGAGIIFVSCFCWWFTALAVLKMPRNRNTDECIENLKGTADKKDSTSTLSTIADVT